MIDVSGVSDSEFIRRKGKMLVKGSNNSVIRLKGINFNNYHWVADGSLIIISQHHSETDFQRVKAMGMNCIRFNLSYVVFEDDASPYSYKQTGWDWLDKNISWAKKYGLYLILDMHVPQGGYQGGTKLWTVAENQNHLIALWQAIASMYNDETTIAAFNLLNEPTRPQNKQQWETLANKLVTLEPLTRTWISVSSV